VVNADPGDRLERGAGRVTGLEEGTVGELQDSRGQRGVLGYQIGDLPDRALIIRRNSMRAATMGESEGRT